MAENAGSGIVGARRPAVASGTRCIVNSDRYCLAEYCRGPFYAGWWLYERETNDGRPNNTGFPHWGWLNAADPWSPQQKLRDLTVWMGHDPPPVARHRQAFAEWFAATFPNGLLVTVSESVEEDRYSLIEILASRPPQKCGVIRTIRGAALADRARQRRREKNAN